MWLSGGAAMPMPTFPLVRLNHFQTELHACYTRRADALANCSATTPSCYPPVGPPRPLSRQYSRRRPLIAVSGGQGSRRRVQCPSLSERRTSPDHRAGGRTSTSHSPDADHGWLMGQHDPGLCPLLESFIGVWPPRPPWGPVVVVEFSHSLSLSLKTWASSITKWSCPGLTDTTAAPLPWRPPTSSGT